MFEQQIRENYIESDHHGFFFTINDENYLEINAVSVDTDESQEKFDLGFKYHVIIYSEEIIPETFDAIIGNPYHYINNLIKSGYEGAIFKISPTITKLKNEIFNELMNSASVTLTI